MPLGHENRITSTPHKTETKHGKQKRKRFKTESPEETQALGEKLGKTLKQGDVIALVGDLGTGKNLFDTRHCARCRYRVRCGRQ